MGDMKTIPLLRFTVFLAAAVAGAAAPAAAPDRVFRAGAATSNITPMLDAFIGTGRAPAKDVHDELHVRCLALDNGATRLVFAVVDSVSVPRDVFDEAKRLIHEATGIPPEHLMMSATHSHSAGNARGANPLDWGVPYPEEEQARLNTLEPGFSRPLHAYQRFLVRRIADGVRRALNNLEPARIGWGAGRVPEHVHSRRWVLKEGFTAANPFGGRDRSAKSAPREQRLRPAGPVNPEVFFISVQSAAGRPIALLANYWLHYVGTRSPAPVFSADYFGVFCDRIQELLGADRQDPPFVGIMANGPCGDVGGGNRAPDAPPPPKYGPFEEMKAVAGDVAQEVFRVYQTLSYCDWVEMKAVVGEVRVKMRQPSSEMRARARRVLALPASPSRDLAREQDYAQRVHDSKRWPESLDVILQAFRIGDLGIAAIPFETFTETGLEIKVQSPFRDTFTIELANGGYGYMPTPEQHDLGGYESWFGPNRVERQASVTVVAKVLELLAAVK